MIIKWWFLTSGILETMTQRGGFLFRTDMFFDENSDSRGNENDATW